MSLGSAKFTTTLELPVTSETIEGALGIVSGLPEARLSALSPAAFVAFICTSKQLEPLTEIVTELAGAATLLHDPGHAFHVNVS